MVVVLEPGINKPRDKLLRLGCPQAILATWCHRLMTEHVWCVLLDQARWDLTRDLRESCWYCLCCFLILEKSEKGIYKARDWIGLDSLN